MKQSPVLAELSPRETIALYFIYDQMANAGRAFPGYQSIAERCICSMTLARRIVSGLVDRGIFLRPTSGAKPRHFSPDGELAAATLFMQVQAGKPLPEVQRMEHTQPQARPQGERVSLLAAVSHRVGIEPEKFLHLIKTQIISLHKDDKIPVSNEECALVLHTMNKYDLDPIVRQIYAFRSRGKLQVIVGYDGWIKIANSRKQYLGTQYEYGDMVEVPGSKLRCPEWIQATVHSGEGRIPTVIRVFACEWYDSRSDNWRDKPSHRLRLKAFCMAVREHFGIAAMDDVDADALRREAHEEFGSRLGQIASERRVSLAARSGSGEIEDADIEPDRAQEPEPEEAPSCPQDERSPQEPIEACPPPDLFPADDPGPILPASASFTGIKPWIPMDRIRAALDEKDRQRKGGELES